MNTHAWWRAMHLIGSELCALTSNDDHLLLRRLARRPGTAITGGTVNGWQATPVRH